MKLTTEHVRAARALLRWSQGELAERSGVSVPTIRRLEMAPGPLAGRADTVWKIQEALEREGINFEDEDGFIGVRLVRR